MRRERDVESRNQCGPQSDESRGMGASHDEDRVGEVPVVGKGRAAQKAIKKVGDGHFAREKVGADKTG